MTSTTYLDSGKQGLKGVFLWQLRRCLPLAVLYAAVLLIGGILPPYYYGSVTYIYAGVAVLGASFLLPLLQYSGCFSRRQADLFHALPVSRADFFWGSALSGLCCLILPMLPSFGIKLAASFAWGLSGIWGTVRVLLLFCLLAALNLAFFTFVVIVSGSILEYGVNSLLFSFCWPALVIFFNQLTKDTIPGIGWNRLPTDSPQIVYAGSPSWSMFFCSLPVNTRDWSSISIWLVLCWAAETALLLGAALFLYRHRQGEIASTPKVCRFPLAILRALLGAAAALAAGTLFSGAFAGSPLIFLVMLAALGLAWIVTELFYFHSLKGLVRRLPCLGGSLALAAALTAVICTGMGLETKIPDPENIVQAEVYMESVNQNVITYLEVARPGEDGYDRSHLLPSIEPALYSPERIRQVREFQEAWMRFEREERYPYVPGQATGSTGVSFHYLLTDGTDYLLTYPWPKDFTAEESQTYTAMAEKLLYSEEYVSGFKFLCAIDAADQIGRATLAPSENYEERKYGPFYDLDELYEVTGFLDPEYGRSEPLKDAREISSLPKDFREKLEAALLDDLSHGRFPSYSQRDAAFYEKGSIEVYEIRYKVGSRFTARGGVLEQEPVKGQEFLFEPADDSDTVFRVWPEMTETYALLRAQYKKQLPA